jgi:hypothetical protein
MTHPEPGRAAESFAQTSAEFTLDDSDDEDLRSAVGGSETYELRERDDRRRVGGGASAIWDADADADADDPLVGGSRRALSPGSVASFQLYTPDEDRAVRRKFDRRLVLFVALLFMLSFLDRSSMHLSSLCMLHTYNPYRYRQRSHSRHGRGPPVRPPAR